MAKKRLNTNKPVTNKELEMIVKNFDLQGQQKSIGVT